MKATVDQLKRRTGSDAISDARSAAANFAPDASAPVQDLLAGELLNISGGYREAQNLLSQIKSANPELSRMPEFQLAWGVSAYGIGKKDQALRAFRSAADPQHASLASGYTAYALTAQGKPQMAESYKENFQSNPKVSHDPWIKMVMHAFFDIFLPE